LNSVTIEYILVNDKFIYESAPKNKIFYFVQDPAEITPRKGSNVKQTADKTQSSVGAVLE